MAKRSRTLPQLPVRPVSVLGALLVALAIWGQAGASSKYVLIAQPRAAHPGDTIYLSGGGFPPNTQLTISSQCYADPAVPSTEITIGTAGPTTNAHGQFVAVPFRVPAFPLKPMGSPLWCQYVPSFAGQGKGLVFPGSGIVYPSDDTFPAADYLTPPIYYSLGHVHGAWTVQLESWPGARMQGTLRYFPSHRVQHIARTLGWQGKANIRVPAGALNTRGRPATIRVTVTSTFAGYDRTMDACWLAKEDSKTRISRCS